MVSQASSYAPPRAGRGRLPSAVATPWIRMSHRLGRHLPGLPALPLMSPGDWLGSLLVPGYAYRAMGRRRLGLWMAGGWVVAALVLLMFRGHPVVGAWALGALASAHTSGPAFALVRARELAPDGPPVKLALRLGLPLALWVAAALTLYWPLDRWITRQVARGVEVDGRRLVVNPRASADQLTRGQVVLYRLEGGVYSRGPEAAVFGSGFGLGEILGLPGDSVTFSSERFRVGSRSAPRLPHMPASGEVAVQPEHWWIWPRVRVLRAPGAGVITEALLDQAQVSQAQYAGRPYRRWFFWRQDMP